MANPTHFDLRSLRVFIKVAETGSLTQAATQSQLTLSAVSKRVAELEGTAGCALLIRGARGVTLTSAGHALHHHARMVLDAVSRMASDVGDYAIGVKGHVRVWANTSSIVQFLPCDLSRFLGANPSVKISLEERLSHEIVSAVSAGHADLGIFAEDNRTSSLDVRHYRSDQLVLLVPAGHPLAGLPRVAFAQTLAYEYVGLNEGSSLLARMRQEALSAEGVLKLRIQVSSFDGICRMIESGLGVGILPLGAVRNELRSAGLATVELTDAWAHRNLCIGTSMAAACTPETLRLLDFLTAPREDG
ncbi:LysR family transcriptional regulator [Pandoraea anhela]|uniref:GntR family transcriptional regulator n=1 Tax=Pandoraea anhela TaxID=2508295 RepID=A0A5E4WDL2_9BURK|nr:LysR family transcriptional regulator [Pandoraea anhela]VVE22481.1 GntR family transcriptional regulator [Pandoraea anhela]